MKILSMDSQSYQTINEISNHISSNLEKIFDLFMSSDEKISICFSNSPEIYTFNCASFSPFFIGDLIGPSYSNTALIIFFFSLE